MLNQKVDNNSTKEEIRNSLFEGFKIESCINLRAVLLMSHKL